MSFEQNVRQVIPYVPGEQPIGKGIIKLNTNECPYPPAPGVEKASKLFQTDLLRLYPDPTIGELSQALADYYQVKKEQVFVGVGSDDVIAMAFMTFFNSDKPILFPQITYSFYDVWANLFRIPYKTLPLDENLRIKMEDYLIPNGGIIIANPNAPTGQFESVSDLEKIIAANPDVVVIIDEAYVDFGGESCIPLLSKYDNLLVVQTFSKSRSMAGMRIGYGIGNEKLIQYLQDVKYSFNSYTLNRQSIELGVEAVKDDVYFKETLQKVIQTREWVKKELQDLGFQFPDSKANFIFATHPSYSAKDLFEALKKEHIYVRHFNKPGIDQYLRISIGTDEEMNVLLEFIRKYCKG